jgi:ABC-type glycerol-3-phosphate transport system substrate-binding protein
MVERMSKHLALLLVLAILLAGCGQGYVERTEQLSKRVKSVVNPDELQAWATNVIAKTSAKNGDISVNPTATGIPKGLLGFSDYPPDVFVSRDGGGGYVVVSFGDFLDHMGLYVGDKSFKAESDQQIYVVPWQPGIYFWHQL